MKDIISDVEFPKIPKVKGKSRKKKESEDNALKTLNKVKEYIEKKQAEILKNQLSKSLIIADKQLDIDRLNNEINDLSVEYEIYTRMLDKLNEGE